MGFSSKFSLSSNTYQSTWSVLQQSVWLSYLLIIRELFHTQVDPILMYKPKFKETGSSACI